jgi:uncharacterized membrane protein YfcA
VELSSLFLVCLAAFFAGGLNSLAGGGSFITLPALLYVGISPVLANTTSAAAILPGYFGSVAGFKKTFTTISLNKIMPLIFLVTIFSVCGAFFLINTSDEFFTKALPFNPQNVREKSQSPRGVYQKIGLSFVSTYGGYFNGGLGLALLSVLSIDKDFSLKQLSAIKSLLSLFITLVSVSVFFLNNFIVWSFVFYMMFFSILGGFMGAKLTEILPNQLLRIFIILVGISLSISLLILNYL